MLFKAHVTVWQILIAKHILSIGSSDPTSGNYSKREKCMLKPQLYSALPIVESEQPPCRLLPVDGLHMCKYKWRPEVTLGCCSLGF